MGRLRSGRERGTLRGMPNHVRRVSAPSLGRATTLALVAALVAGLFVVVAPATPAAAAEPDYPSYDRRYHSNAEMVAEIKAAQAAYPDLVKVMSIGKSYQGRDIWVAKISDNVATDESEPEVMVDALHHARERLSLEQALYLLRVLTRDYRSDPVVRSLVNLRETWIVFSVNPDGHVYDVAGFPNRLWRRNRQPTPGSRYVGTDINRNYDYRWGCCRGSSTNPAAWNYRGPAPFSTPEARVIRDFVNSRVVGGRQQIRLHVTLHTNGQQVLWPYGHTKTNVPADMTVDDHRALVAIGKGMASRNGYKPMQSSDLYITDGDEIDWMYGRHRIFSYTWELYPPETPSDATDHYSPDEIIARETARNWSALLYALRMAACPYDVIGRGDANCGPFFDDMEGRKGWTIDPDGTDTAASGSCSAPFRRRPSRRGRSSLPRRPPARASGSPGPPAGEPPAPMTSTGSPRSARPRSPSRRRPVRCPSGITSPMPPARPRTTGCVCGWRRRTGRERWSAKSSARRTTTTAPDVRESPPHGVGGNRHPNCDRRGRQRQRQPRRGSDRRRPRRAALTVWNARTPAGGPGFRRRYTAWLRGRDSNP